MPERPKPGLLTLLIAYATFVLLGIPDAMLGVAWPTMQKTFDQPLDALGIVMGAGTVGYLLSSFSSGRLVGRIGIGTFLLIACLLRLVALAGYGIAPIWPVLIAFGFVSGLGGGSIDAGLNTYVATHYSAGRLNWLHAAFGVGATIGPLIMTFVLEQLDERWRLGYAAVSVLQGLLLIVFIVTLPRWQTPLLESEPGATAPRRVTARQTLMLPIVWFGILVFIFYTGTEMAFGTWPYSMFTKVRDISESTAGVWVSVYWGALTVGRILAGLITDRVGPMPILRASMIGSLFGALLVWVNAGSLINFVGMALAGFSLAAIFPLLISITPGRVGPLHAPNAIGFQVGAAGVGGALIPAIAGVLAKNQGLEIIGPFLTLTSLIMLVLYELTIHRAGRPVPQVATKAAPPA